MKRFIYVPHEMARDGIPEEAVNLANDCALQIRVGDNEDGFDLKEIGFISVPEFSMYDCPGIGRAGFTHQIDITDEFVSFAKNTRLKIIYEDEEYSFNPRLIEKHTVRFRPRLPKPGSVTCVVESDEKVVYSGTFEVI
jgi:hypothetical protein